MLKPEQAIERLQGLLDEATQREAQTNHAINLRKKLVEQGSLLLRSYKDLIKQMARTGISTKHINKIKTEAVYEYQQHVNVLAQLKRMNADARSQVYDFTQVLEELKPNDSI